VFILNCIVFILVLLLFFRVLILCLYERAISLSALERYISKYASKMPSFGSRRAFFEYCQASYKLHMHRYGTDVKRDVVDSDWILMSRSSGSGYMCFFELECWMENYFGSIGLGG